MQKSIPVYQVDAFTTEVFRGNPAAVCLLEEWLLDDVLQHIAAENNLAETAFFVKAGMDYLLRWFTPKVEIDLCGHATLAAAHIIFSRIDQSARHVTFQTKSGALSVLQCGNLLTMDFPSRPADPIRPSYDLLKVFGNGCEEFLLARDLLVVYKTESDIVDYTPDFIELATLKEGFGVIISAPGKEVDFVSRFFAPKAGIPEDPVTGSAHCTLIPYWSKQLDKTVLHARQLSGRQGELFCEYDASRVRISGYAVLFLEGTISL